MKSEFAQELNARALVDKVEELEAENKSLVKFLTMDDASHGMWTRIKELEATVKCLWNLIDDIDTASDIAKSNDIWYRKRTEALVDHRWATGITTDGYTLDLTKLTSIEYSDTFPDTPKTAGEQDDEK
jgi:hypothetical protein